MEQVDTIENIILKDWKTNKRIEKIKLEVDDNKNNNSFLSNLSSKQDLNIKQISITQNSKELPRNFINHIFQSEVGRNIEIINVRTQSCTNLTHVSASSIIKL